MEKPTIHLPVCFHTIPDQRHSHCAFTAKCLKFSKMMHLYGWRVVEYSNGVSESEADEKVQMLTQEELERLAGKREHTAFHGATAVIGSPHWHEFDRRLKIALRARVKPRDFIVHPFGRSHVSLIKEFPEQIHGEFSGIGYPDKEFGAYRVFESQAWMHFHAGGHLNFDGAGRVNFRDNLPSTGKNGSDFADWICPNYFDLLDWTPRYASGEYLVFMGRICTEKGLDIIKAVAENTKERILVAGQGDITPWKHPRLEYVGPVVGKARDEFIGKAKAMLMPTRFIEPFAGSGVESQLCGTPLLCSDFGAFTETVEHGKTGYRCRVLGDWIKAIELAPTLDREYVAARARRLYSLETCGAIVDRILRQIMTLHGPGWYTKEPIWVQ